MAKWSRYPSARAASLRRWASSRIFGATRGPIDFEASQASRRRSVSVESRRTSVISLSDTAPAPDDGPGGH